MLKKTLEDLCAFGHRATTTENERKAAQYLSQSLSGLGYSAALEEFRSPATFSWTYFVIYLALAISIPLYIYLPLPGLIIFLAALLLFLGEQTTLFSPLTETVFATGTSQNVVAAPAAAEKKRHTLWLVAHYDTSKTSLAFSPKSRPLLKPLFFFSLILLAGCFAVILFCFATELAQRLPLKIFLWFSGVYFFYMAAMMLERELRGVPVQGAADNASGVAVVMELAKRLSRKPLSNTNLRILLTGAEEVEMVGMMHFMKKRRQELSRESDWFINFDSIGQGRLCWVTKEGMIRPLSGSERLIKLAEELARKDQFKSITGCPFTTLTLDTLVPRARGFQVLSFMALSAKGFPAPWHWFDDTIEKVELDKLALAADFAEELARAFDRGISRS